MFGLPFASSVIARGTAGTLGLFDTIMLTIVPPSNTTLIGCLPPGGTTLRTSGCNSYRCTIRVSVASKFGYFFAHDGCTAHSLKIAAMPSCALFHVHGRLTMF